MMIQLASLIVFLYHVCLYVSAYDGDTKNQITYPLCMDRAVFPPSFFLCGILTSDFLILKLYKQ